MATTSFLDLPAELRYRCYNFTLAGIEAHLFADGLSFIDGDTKYSSHPLQQVCVQARREILPLLHVIPLRIRDRPDKAELLATAHVHSVETIIIPRTQVSNLRQLAQIFHSLKDIVVRSMLSVSVSAYNNTWLYEAPSSERIKEHLKLQASGYFDQLRNYMSFEELPGITLTIQMTFDVDTWDASKKGYKKKYMVN